MNKNSKCQETQFTVYTKINKYQQTQCSFYTQGQRVWVISNDSGWEYSGLLKASATENVEGLQGLPAKRRLAGIVTISAYRGCSNNSLKGGRYGIPKPLQLCLPRAGCGQNYVVCFCLILFFVCFCQMLSVSVLCSMSLFIVVWCCLFHYWVCMIPSVAFLTGSNFVCLPALLSPLTCISFLPFLPPYLPFPPPLPPFLSNSLRQSQPPGWRGR